MTARLDYFTNGSSGNRAFNEAFDLLRALQRHLEGSPIAERDKLVLQLAEHGAPLIGTTTIARWLDELQDPADSPQP